MPKILPVSVYIITLNEEQYIGATLDRMADFDEVIVVDSGSSDRTVKIAQRYENVRVFHNDWPGFSEQKAHALSLCRNEWVLNIDADELLTEELITDIENTIRENKVDALESTRTLVRWGKVPKNLAKPDRLIRFFRKANGKYEFRRVHESISIVGEIKKTNSTIYHCENDSYSERVAKSNRYSELCAQDKHDSGCKVSLLKIVFAFPIAFLKLYIIKGHCLDGTEGFLTSMNAAFYTFMKYAKLWEIQNRHAAATDAEPNKLPNVKMKQVPAQH